MIKRKSIFMYAIILVIVVTSCVYFVAKLSEGNFVTSNGKLIFNTDLVKYKQELQTTILKEKMKDPNLKEYLINEKDVDRIKKFIPSLDDKYKDVIEIKKGNIFYKGKNKEYKKIAAEVGAYIIKEDSLGEGTRTKAFAKWSSPYVPKGFSYLEGTVNTGYVIIDDILENEFVWIPVENTGLKANLSEMGDYKKENFPDVKANVDITKTEDLSIDELKKCIKTYGGFYVARYEAGVEEIDKKPTLVSKPNVESYCKVTGEEAEILSANFYANQNVGTMLIPGAAFDSVIKFMAKTNNMDVKALKQFAISNGNFSYDVLKTGSSKTFAINNIYDLAGNVFEFTAEVDKASKKYILRGGCVGYNPEKISLTRRNIPVDGYEKSILIGFRPVLYIK